MRKKTLLILIFFLFSLLFSFRVREVLAQVENVAINEFVPKSSQEWVEFYNKGTSVEDLSTYFFDDDANFDSDSGSRSKFQLIGLLIPQTTCFWNIADYLNDGGDVPTLFHSDGTSADSYPYTETILDKSYSRVPNGGDWQANQTPTKSSVECLSLAPTPTPVPTAIPTSEPTVVPTSSPTNTPTPTLTPTPKPTAVPTIKPTPTFGISLEPTDNLAPEFGQAGDLPAEDILGMEASSGGEASSSSNFSKFIKNIPWFPVIAVGIGVLFVGFSLFTFIKGNRKIPPPNL